MVRFVTTVAMVLCVSSASAERVATVRGKPTAPLVLELVERPLAGGREVTVVALPRRALPSVELELAGRRIAVGRSDAGQRRELTVVVAGDGVVQATARAGTHLVSRVLGGAVTAPTRAAPGRATLRTLPDGRVVREVR